MRSATLVPSILTITSPSLMPPFWAALSSIDLGDRQLVELHAERPAVGHASPGAELLAREQVVEVGDPVSPQRHDQRRVLLVLGDGRVERVELGMVGVLVDGLARLSPEEARHVRREERGVVAAAADQAGDLPHLERVVPGRAP